MDKNISNTYLENKNVLNSIVKNYIFDIISVVVIISMTVLSLGVIELRTIDWKELLDVVLECTPFYLCSNVLTRSYYSKGVRGGKDTEAFKNAVAYYSEKVTTLSGEKLSLLPDFCKEYNDKILDAIIDAELHTVAITLDRFKTYDDLAKAPLKKLGNRVIKKLYGKEVAKVVKKCKKIRIKGLSTNILLGHGNVSDGTDLGLDEKQLARRRLSAYSISYVASIFVLSLVGIKDVFTWGWVGAFLTLFKVTYIGVSSYLKYFDGFEDLSVNVVNYMYRKTDVLKEYDVWYSNKTKEKSVQE